MQHHVALGLLRQAGALLRLRHVHGHHEFGLMPDPLVGDNQDIGAVQLNRALGGAAGVSGKNAVQFHGLGLVGGVGWLARLVFGFGFNGVHHLDRLVVGDFTVGEHGEVGDTVARGARQPAAYGG